MKKTAKPYRRLLWYIFLLPLLLAQFLVISSDRAEAAKKIIFIAHDARPICLQQTAEVAEKAGYKLIMPPRELLAGGIDRPGNSERLWQWLDKNAASAQAAVISSDAMLYGGLINSRRHDFSPETINERVENFAKLHEKNPKLHIYLFGSLMRTPRNGIYAGTEELPYYQDYGEDIFNFTSLADRAELGLLSSWELEDMEAVRQRIPAHVMNDWMGRREKNFAATKKLVDLTAQGTVECFLVGRDDNAPFCQTHKENRELLAYAESQNLPQSKFQSLTGIDEFNLLLLARAANTLRKETPSVHVQFNEGAGKATIPAFSDEPIGDSIQDAIIAAGGKTATSPSKADFILLVNTNPDGSTGEASFITPGMAPLVNDGAPREGTLPFVRKVADLVSHGAPVGIADIAFANGSDNALMLRLEQEGVLDKLRSYAGWNTPTNSSGFALGTGMLSIHMKKSARKQLLTRRYLDDWAYQANVRPRIHRELMDMGQGHAYVELNEMRRPISSQASYQLQAFAQDHLPRFKGIKELKVDFPWNRMFECEIFF